MTNKQTVALPSDREVVARATAITQTTAVEQARAVAEVQSQVIVAQQVPRDQHRARAEMREACGRTGLAERAFYKVPNRGTGASVHLARELARIWGNVNYGVKELRRDDTAGESEVMAYAWDVQTNTRSERSFVVPHARMKQGKREKLVDLGDIYLSNQNVGARAVRECIFTVLPTEFVDEAMDLCRETIKHGEGEPLDERVTKMVAAFGDLGVSLARLEARIGRRRAQWTAADVAEMKIAYRSITREGLSADDEFPEQRVTAAEIAGAGETPTLDVDGA